jgi:hypothetical protein
LAAAAACDDAGLTGGIGDADDANVEDVADDDVAVVAAAAAAAAAGDNTNLFEKFVKNALV